MTVPSGANVYLWALGTPSENLSPSSNKYLHCPKFHSVELVSSGNTPPSTQAVEQTGEDTANLCESDEPLICLQGHHFPKSDPSAPGCAENLQCVVCKSPAYKPVGCLACRNLFCEECVLGIEECPECKARLSTSPETLKAVTDPLNKLRLNCYKCNACMLRNDYPEHVQKHCMKARVRCMAADSLCAWKGPRETFADHLPNCHHRAIAPQFAVFTTKQASFERELELRAQQFATLTSKQASVEHELELLATITQQVAALTTTVANVMRDLEEQRAIINDLVQKKK